ncbi:MAG: TRAP transporter substrate-binding protein DctP [Deltaproteobacteria bacterium]|nr:TRAP transporter substrate-binding protein DctP [Deltaproteobacteria bacterium]
MKKSAIILLTLFVAFSLVFAIDLHPSYGAKKISIKLTTIQMPKQQMGRAALKLGKVVNRELGDRVQMKVYTSAQLYRGKEEMEALIRGEIQMAFVIGSRLETIDPALQCFKLPYLFPNVDIAYRVLGGPLGKDLFKMLPPRNLQFLGIVHAGNVVFSNAKRPLLWPEDFKGLKIRSYGRMGKDTAAFLGATAVVTPSSETFSALQTGVIDGVMTPNSVYLLRKYNTIQKYVTDGGLVNFTNSVLLANLKFWNGLPPDVRTKLKGMVDGLIAEMRAEMKADNEAIFDRIKASGNEVYRLTPEQVAAWKKALQALYDKYGPEIGKDLIERLEREIARLSP